MALKGHELFVIWHSITCKSVTQHVFCYCISKTNNEFGQNPEENIIWTGPSASLYTVIWTGSLTKTNRENVNVKYNIKRLLHDIFHIGFGISPRLPYIYQGRCGKFHVIIYLSHILHLSFSSIDFYIANTLRK
jgi:hypothetical protein